jgi:enoyl-[acyl-carrier protein] reductase III
MKQTETELPFAEKVALVTGSGRGIGRAIALHFARLGADLVVNFFRNRAPAEQTAEEIRAMGRRAWVVRADVGEIEQIEFLFTEISQLVGEVYRPAGIDILVHNAASGYNRPVLEQKPKGWDWTMNINARSLLFMAQQVVPLMKARGGGSIVGISSPGATHVLPEYVVVGASKAALEALVRYLAVELAPYHINVNAVSPGMVLTDALQHFDTIRSDEQIIQKAINRTPTGRLTTPEDVAEVVSFLCSPSAEMIRGQVIVVDGGFTLAPD